MIRVWSEGDDIYDNVLILFMQKNQEEPMYLAVALEDHEEETYQSAFSEAIPILLRRVFNDEHDSE